MITFNLYSIIFLNKKIVFYCFFNLLVVLNLFKIVYIFLNHYIKITSLSNKLTVTYHLAVYYFYINKQFLF